ncbi:trehalose-phosphatase [Methanobacterium ferruginis]|uniref:trehalose-phosphatase n=1 Tax=Methanobacterium ferruginis TaxID=710191 RepID=UPI0025744247|nr:trehalose-phosphatase [Methanobacterium ferruginis]BDZ66582.1 trehalose-phosphatase [Methanobacterium ferruginis]BDZ69480.1 trehalose-phosphatase [Methanobacterium ferruginis]
MSEYLFDNLKILEEFKNDKSTAIITDIDGTISEITQTPEEAFVNKAIQDLIVKLRDEFQLVAVISGRSVLNAKKMVGVEGVLYVGNHGLEFLKNGELCVQPEVVKYEPYIKAVENELETGKLAHIKGLKFEDKGICFSIHYRLSKDPENTRKRILKFLHECPHCKNLKIDEGRRIVELKPPIGYNKGVIMNDIIDQYHLKKVIYLGDDITDVNAFNKLKELESKGKIRGRSVLVCSSEIPSYVKKQSSLFVNGVDEVHKFFQWLLN